MANEAGALRWRCRRGMKELDLLLERFLDCEYAASTPAAKAAFAAMLEWPDPQIMACLMQQTAPPDPETANVVERIRATGRS